MAEFIGQRQDVTPETEDGFSNMGKPIPSFRREAAYRTCRDAFGMDADRSHACVSGIAEQLERDNPYEAMAAGMKYIDLTGTYRLFAVLLIHPAPKPEPELERTMADLYG